MRAATLIASGMPLLAIQRGWPPGHLLSRLLGDRIADDVSTLHFPARLGAS